MVFEHPPEADAGDEARSDPPKADRSIFAHPPSNKFRVAERKSLTTNVIWLKGLVVLNDTLKKYFAGQKGIVAVYLFGSHAKRKSHAKSDIDLAVLYDKKAGSKALDRSLKMTCDLMKLLNRDKIDIVTLNTASPILKNQVYKYGLQLFCKNPVEAIRFKARTFLEYLDIQPIRMICEIAIKQKALSYGR